MVAAEQRPWRCEIVPGHRCRKSHLTLHETAMSSVPVVAPEFTVSKRRHQLLHGQTALVIKSRLLFERGVVAVSVPYHIEE